MSQKRFVVGGEEEGEPVEFRLERIGSAIRVVADGYYLFTFTPGEPVIRHAFVDSEIVGLPVDANGLVVIEDDVDVEEI